MQIHLVWDEEADADLIVWWLALPKGMRTQALRKVLRWYVTPGGFGDLVTTLERLAGGSLASGPSQPVPPLPNFHETLQATLAGFGWDDD